MTNQTINKLELIYLMFLVDKKTKEIEEARSKDDLLYYYVYGGLNGLDLDYIIYIDEKTEYTLEEAKRFTSNLKIYQDTSCEEITEEMFNYIIKNKND